MKNPIIIGAGGVASYLIAPLCLTFQPSSILLIDKDVLEEKNLSRQLFRPDQIGQNKAEALGSLHADTNPKVTFEHMTEWFTDAGALPEKTDAIICCADNHLARFAAVQHADRIGCYCYIGGNEYLDSQAFVYHPDWKGTQRDVVVRYPNIATDHTGSPVRCQGEILESTPQLAVANMNCAAKLLHLMWVYERWVPENTRNLDLEAKKKIISHMPCELFTSLNDNSLVT